MPNASLLVFVGPTAAGKTTRARLLCRKIKDKCFLRVIEPFGGLAYIFIAFIVFLITTIRPQYKQVLRVKKYLAFLETYSDFLLTKFLPLIIFLDTISILIRTFCIMALRVIVRNIILEDYIPQALIDYIAYSIMYLRDKRKPLLVKISIILLYKVIGFLRDCTCIALYAPLRVRIKRAISRKDNPLITWGFYNDYLRTVAVVRLCKQLQCKVVALHTGSTA